MSDYIDREKFIKLLVNRDLREISTKTIGECLDKAEVADVIEVVRCRDCEFWNKDEDVLNGGICDEWSDFEDGLNRYTKGDDYCSLGERKEK